MNSEKIKTLSQRLAEGLEMRNMKQIELSEKTGISRGAISSYLTGRWEPKQNNIFLIAKALDLSEAWLMGYDVPPKRDYNQNNISYNKMPNDLNKFLSQAQVVFDGELYNLDDEDRQLIMKSLEVAFAAAKQANKRKK